MSLGEAAAEATVVRWCEEHCGKAVEIVSRQRTAPTQFSVTFKPKGAGKEAAETRVFDFGHKQAADSSSTQPGQWTITASRPTTCRLTPATENASNGTQTKGAREHHIQSNAGAAGVDGRDADDEDDEDYGGHGGDDADVHITSTEAAEELAELQEDQEMSVEDLRKLYGSPQEAAAREQEVLSSVTPEQAMQLATQWYNTYGPYRATYTMRAQRAFRNTPSQWSIKFRVTPDTSFLYFRRFHVAVDDGQALVVRWSEDPEVPPGAEYDPLDDVEGGGDDVDTEDEEMLAEDEAAHGDSDNDNDNELADLQADNELSVEELMAKYYGSAGAAAAGASAGEDGNEGGTTTHSASSIGAGGKADTEEVVEEKGDLSSGRRRRRQAAQQLKPQEEATAADAEVEMSKTRMQQPEECTPVASEEEAAAAGAQSVTKQAPEGADAKRANHTRDGEGGSGEHTAKRAKTAHQNEDAPEVDATAAPVTATTPQPQATNGGGNQHGSDDDDDDDDDDADWCSDVDGNDPLLQYMRRAAEEVDAHEEYVSNYKPPKLGPQYQAVIPSAPGNASPVREESANQVWAPVPSNTGVTVDEVKRYEDLYRGHDRQHEHALTALFHHDYDVTAARKAMEAYIEPDPWTPEEVERLYRLIVTERRQFHRISALMPNRSTRSIIRCYYDTKKLRARCLSDHRDYVLSSDDENEEYEQPADGSPSAQPPAIAMTQAPLVFQAGDHPPQPSVLAESMLLSLPAHTYAPAHHLRPSPGPPRPLPSDAPLPFGGLLPPHQHAARPEERRPHDLLLNPTNPRHSLPSSSSPPPPSPRQQ